MKKILLLLGYPILLLNLHYSGWFFLESASFDDEILVQHSEFIRISRKVRRLSKCSMTIIIFFCRKTGITLRPENIVQDEDALDNIDTFWNAALTSPESKFFRA